MVDFRPKHNRCQNQNPLPIHSASSGRYGIFASRIDRETSHIRPPLGLCATLQYPPPNCPPPWPLSRCIVSPKACSPRRVVSGDRHPCGMLPLSSCCVDVDGPMLFPSIAAFVFNVLVSRECTGAYSANWCENESQCHEKWLQQHRKTAQRCAQRTGYQARKNESNSQAPKPKYSREFMS